MTVPTGLSIFRDATSESLSTRLMKIAALPINKEQTTKIGPGPHIAIANPPLAGVISLIKLNPNQSKENAFCKFDLRETEAIKAILAGSITIHDIPTRKTKRSTFQVSAKPYRITTE